MPSHLVDQAPWITPSQYIYCTCCSPMGGGMAQPSPVLNGGNPYFQVRPCHYPKATECVLNVTLFPVKCTTFDQGAIWDAGTVLQDGLESVHTLGLIVVPKVHQPQPARPAHQDHVQQANIVERCR